ncbi:hypothetical protein OG300_17500 [Nocardia sp. NBC_00511]
MKIRRDPTVATAWAYLDLGFLPGPLRVRRRDLRSDRRAGTDSLYRTQCHFCGQAINAARMAMRGKGIHRVSLDQVLETMRATGRT